MRGTRSTAADAGQSLSAPAVTLSSRQRRLRRTLECLTGVAFTEGNELTVLRNGDRIFPAMLDAIDGARRSVDLMTYVYWKGDIAHRFAEGLSAAAGRGVRVRLLIDAVGGLQIEKGLVDRMDKAGVHVEWFRKPWLKSPFKHNHRCHRKVLVVDEQLGFIGGVGIAEEWCGDARNEREWRDTHARVRGPAVDGLSAAFSQNWAESGRELYDDVDLFPDQPQPGNAVVQVVRGSASLGWDDLQTTFRVMLDTAQHRLRLATAYFAPDDFFLERLCAAARRGVEVDVMLPGPHADKRVCQLASEATYAGMIDCGIRVWSVPAVNAAREDHDRGRHRGTDRLVELQPALTRPRRGSPALRPRRRCRRPARRRLRRRHPAQRPDRPDQVARAVGQAARHGSSHETDPPLVVKNMITRLLTKDRNRSTRGRDQGGHPVSHSAGFIKSIRYPRRRSTVVTRVIV